MSGQPNTSIRPQPSSQLGSLKLENLWQKVLSQYTERAVHESFVQECLKDSKLPYASFRYKKMLEGAPHDEMAKQMIDYIIQIATYNVQLETKNAPSESSGVLSYLGYGACLILGGVLLLAPEYAKVFFIYVLGVFGLAAAGVFLIRLFRNNSR